MKVLVSFEDEHRAYMETTAYAVRMRHPRLDLIAVESESLRAEVKRADPALVIRYTRKDRRCARNTLELATDSGRTSRVCLGGRCRDLDNPSSEELLAIVDYAQNLAALSSDGTGGF